MSTLKTANIQDTSGNNNSTPEQISQGRAKAWVVFNGTTGTPGNPTTLGNSYNVSSVTDIAPGRYDVNFTIPFADANYCVTHGGSFAAGNGWYHWYDNESTTSVRLAFISSGGSYADPPHISCVIHGV
jgi:hypothetical protein